MYTNDRLNQRKRIRFRFIKIFSIFTVFSIGMSIER
jgi:hypothetical protein